jgi:hypothetical protein
MESFDSQVPIRLDDLIAGTSQDVRLQPTLSFTSAPGDIENRFRLRFASALEIYTDPAKDFSIFASQHQVVVKTTAEEAGTMYIYSVSGQLIAQCMLTAGETQLTLNASGVYLVKVITGKAIITKKVIIN